MGSGSIFFSQPYAAAPVFKAEGEIFLKLFLMELFQKGIEKDDFEAAVVLQKSPQQVALVPRSPFIDPFARVLEGVKDVVEMNQDPFFEAGKNVEKNPIDVTSGFGDMGRVNDEQVIFIQLFEQPEIDILQDLLDDLVVFLILGS